MKPKTIIRATAAFRAAGTDIPNVEYYSTISNYLASNSLPAEHYQSIVYCLREKGVWYNEQMGHYLYRVRISRLNYTGTKHKNLTIISDMPLSDITAMSQAKFLFDHPLGSEGYHFFTKNAGKGNRNATIRYKDDWVIARKIVKTPLVARSEQHE